jgi:hypothetical protein
MTKPTKKVTFTLTPAEYDKLNSRAHKAKLSMTDYFRALLKGLEPKGTPPPDYFAMMSIVANIGNDLHELVQIAKANNDINADLYMSKVQKLDWFINDVRKEIVMPGSVKWR